MKSKPSSVAILCLLLLVSCTPASIHPTPTNTSVPTATLISTTVPAAPTFQPAVTPSDAPTSTPSVWENATEDCFVTIDFIPKKTRMNEVVFVWGNPSEKSSFDTDWEYWYFDFAGAPHIRFDKQILDQVTFHLKGCTLEKIISQLGPPEKVEITVSISCIGGPPWITQNFHYPSLGFSYFRSCDEIQNCYAFYPSDLVGGKEFYSSDTVIEDFIGFNMSGNVYSWHGFGVNVEEVENKMDNFPNGTPGP